MRRIIILLFLLLIISSLFAQMQGKRPTPYGFDVNVKPPIYYDLYFSINPENLQPQINFMLNIQYDLLFFTRTDSGYTSGYNISLFIKNIETEEIVYSHLWKEKVHEENFKITNSRTHYHLNSKIFPADFSQGKYVLTLELTDETSRDGFKSKRALEIPDLNADSFTSQIVFITKDKSRSAEIVVGENQTTLEFNEDIYPYFETILPDPGRATLTSELFRVEEEEKSLIKSEQYDLDFKGNHARHSEVIKRKNLQEGDYLLKYQLKAGDFSKVIEKKFIVVWYRKPIFLYDREMALLPMRYILPEDEWQKVGDYSDDEQDEWFKKFWEDKDPDPETPLNEVQIEFYHRVSSANKKFRAEDYEGWDTDRGKSLILYGEPDRVDSQHYLDNSQPYEIWYYESKNKKLIFVDADEDKSFRLVSVEEIGEKNE